MSDVDGSQLAIFQIELCYRLKGATFKFCSLITWETPWNTILCLSHSGEDSDRFCTLAVLEAFHLRTDGSGDPVLTLLWDYSNSKNN